MKREDLNFYLQQADVGEIHAICQRINGMADVQVIQQPTPQTLMLPVADPVNQGSFYGGEVLVTSVIVRINEVNGWSMVMDENQGLALDLAILDGAYAAGIEQDSIDILVRQAKDLYQKNINKTASDVSSTRVSFDLM